MTASQFRAPWWARNPHVQTILPVMTKHRLPKLQRQRLELADGDFIDLDWLTPHIAAAPTLVLVHGLEGSSQSHYARRMLQQCQRLGLNAVVHHHRGCSGEDNRLPRSYHSGDTADLHATLSSIKQAAPQQPLWAVGYSLGGNMLAKYLAEQGENCLLQAAAVVSAPLELAGCARKLEHGFSRIYQRHLLRQLQRKMQLKQQRHPSLTMPDLASLNTFYRFDDRITAPMHGFAGADDYYQRASAKPLLAKISVPTLILHAADDPFMSASVIPEPTTLPTAVRYELAPHGGHVGFINGGTPWRPRYYLESRVLNFLQEYPQC
ncbi:hydrolase [Shewanella sp. C32]|uniref:Hydrolase n=1 Tax=Shewanella electrica TaxID=515560 RepID=A0ABT2FHT3_9GAMM|nr:hydrolase [Shewanella electrica]MCH1923992.1 hydrolase [Shewanella electrica]MCS4555895.1 hydrolase [Shewanella electrica]